MAAQALARRWAPLPPSAHRRRVAPARHESHCSAPRAWPRLRRWSPPGTPAQGAPAKCRGGRWPGATGRQRVRQWAHSAVLDARSEPMLRRGRKRTCKKGSPASTPVAAGGNSHTRVATVLGRPATCPTDPGAVPDAGGEPTLRRGREGKCKKGSPASTPVAAGGRSPAGVATVVGPSHLAQQSWGRCVTPVASLRSGAGGSARARKILQRQPPRQQATAHQQGSPPWSAVLHRAQPSPCGLPRASCEAVAAFARPSSDLVARRRRTAEVRASCGCRLRSSPASSGPPYCARRPSASARGCSGRTARPPGGVAVRSETSARGRARPWAAPQTAPLLAKERRHSRGARPSPPEGQRGSGALSAADWSVRPGGRCTVRSGALSAAVHCRQRVAALPQQGLPWLPAPTPPMEVAQRRPRIHGGVDGVVEDIVRHGGAITASFTLCVISAFCGTRHSRCRSGLRTRLVLTYPALAPLPRCPGERCTRFGHRPCSGWQDLSKTAFAQSERPPGLDQYICLCVYIYIYIRQE